MLRVFPRVSHVLLGSTHRLVRRVVSSVLQVLTSRQLGHLLVRRAELVNTPLLMVQRVFQLVIVALKEPTLLQSKLLAFLRAHCVEPALTLQMSVPLIARRAYRVALVLTLLLKAQYRVLTVLLVLTQIQPV